MLQRGLIQPRGCKTKYEAERKKEKLHLLSCSFFLDRVSSQFGQRSRSQYHLESSCIRSRAQRHAGGHSVADELWGCSSRVDVPWDHHKVGYFVSLYPVAEAHRTLVFPRGNFRITRYIRGYRPSRRTTGK